MKEAVRYLLGVIGRVINFLFPFWLPQRIYQHMGFKGTFVFKIEKNKLRFMNTRDMISNDIFYSGIFGNFEGETLRLWYEISKQVNGLILDLGAFSGIFSLVAASANKQSSIIAFEPDKGSFDLLCKNIQINEFSNITSDNRAMSNKTGKEVFYMYVEGRTTNQLTMVNHHNIPFVDPGSSTITCETVSFKEYLESNHKEKTLSLVKFDIDRAELKVLKDGIERIQKDQTIIICEILDRETIFAIHSLFNKINYVLININDQKKRLIYSGASIENLVETENLGLNWLLLPKQVMESKNIKDILLKFNSNKSNLTEA